MKRRAVFLDRDGVIVCARVREGRPYSAMTPGELEIMPGAAAALRQLHAAGFLLLGVTNQPEVARGRLSLATLDAMHDRLRQELPLDGIYVCPHDDADHCSCRKPKPGLLNAGARQWNVDLGRSFLVGDRWRDLAAGAAAGCKTVFIDWHYEERLTIAPDACVADIQEAADWILRQP